MPGQINDLRYTFFGGGTDAEYSVLTAASAAGVTASTLVAGANVKRPAGVYFYADGRGDSIAHNPTTGEGRAYPIKMSAPQAIDRVNLGVTVGVATAVMRVGLYSADATGAPATLLTDFGGTFDGATTSESVSRTVTYTIPAGLLWVVYVQQTAIATWRGGSLVNSQNYTTVVSNDAPRVMKVTGSIAGALPGTFPGFHASNTESTFLKVGFRAV